jgi:phage-related protein
MTPPTLITTVNPSYSSSKETAYRIKKADFGDGYSQRTGDGVIPSPKKACWISRIYYQRMRIPWKPFWNPWADTYRSITLYRWKQRHYSGSQ